MNVLGISHKHKYIRNYLHDIFKIFKNPNFIKRIQFGGKLKKVFVDNNEYFINLKTNKYIDDTNTEYELILLSFDGKENCGIILIQNDTAVIEGIRHIDNCVANGRILKDDTISAYIVDKDIGTTLMKIMIEICKKKHVTTIQLTDLSRQTCINGTIDMDFKYLYTITHGLSSWYSKFGFQPIDNKDKEVFDYNYNKMKTYLTKDLDIIELFDNSVDIDKHQNDITTDIISIFNQRKDDKLSNTLRFLYRNKKYCRLMSLVYMKIFYKLGLKQFKQRLIMIKRLK